MATLATQQRQLTVHVQGGGARALVQIVHVLGDQSERDAALCQCPLEARQGEVRRVGRYVCQGATTELIEAPDQRRVRAPGFGRGHLFNPVALPKTPPSRNVARPESAEMPAPVRTTTAGWGTVLMRADEHTFRPGRVAHSRGVQE